MGRVALLLVCVALPVLPASGRMPEPATTRVVPERLASSLPTRGGPPPAGTGSANGSPAQHHGVRPREAPEPPPPPTPLPEPERSGWRGYTAAHERHVRLALARAEEARRIAASARRATPDLVPACPGGPGDEPVSSSEPSEERLDADVLPTRLAFGPVSPNPTAGDVVFRVDLPAAGVVRIAILDVAGRVVHQLGGPRQAGRLTFTWDGRPWATRSGVYFAQLEVNARPVGVRRVVMVR